ncbi:MAG: hypothetical protein ABH827_05970 [bacterium]
MKKIFVRHLMVFFLVLCVGIGSVSAGLFDFLAPKKTTQQTQNTGQATSVTSTQSAAGTGGTTGQGAIPANETAWQKFQRQTKDGLTQAGAAIKKVTTQAVATVKKVATQVVGTAQTVAAQIKVIISQMSPVVKTEVIPSVKRNIERFFKQFPMKLVLGMLVTADKATCDEIVATGVTKKKTIDLAPAVQFELRLPDFKALIKSVTPAKTPVGQAPVSSGLSAELLDTFVPVEQYLAMQSVQHAPVLLVMNDIPSNLVGQARLAVPQGQLIVPPAGQTSLQPGTPAVNWYSYWIKPKIGLEFQMAGFSGKVVFHPTPGEIAGDITSIVLQQAGIPANITAMASLAIGKVINPLLDNAIKEILKDLGPTGEMIEKLSIVRPEMTFFLNVFLCFMGEMREIIEKSKQAPMGKVSADYIVAAKLGDMQAEIAKLAADPNKKLEHDIVLKDFQKLSKENLAITPKTSAAIMMELVGYFVTGIPDVLPTVLPKWISLFDNFQKNIGAEVARLDALAKRAATMQDSAGADPAKAVMAKQAAAQAALIAKMLEPLRALKTIRKISDFFEQIPAPIRQVFEVVKFPVATALVQEESDFWAKYPTGWQDPTIKTTFVCELVDALYAADADRVASINVATFTPSEFNTLILGIQYTLYDMQKHSSNVSIEQDPNQMAETPEIDPALIDQQKALIVQVLTKVLGTGKLTPVQKTEAQRLHDGLTSGDLMMEKPGPKDDLIKEQKTQITLFKMLDIVLIYLPRKVQKYPAMADVVSSSGEWVLRFIADFAFAAQAAKKTAIAQGEEFNNLGFILSFLKNKVLNAPPGILDPILTVLEPFKKLFGIGEEMWGKLKGQVELIKSEALNITQKIEAGVKDVVDLGQAEVSTAVKNLAPDELQDLGLSAEELLQFQAMMGEQPAQDFVPEETYVPAPVQETYTPVQETPVYAEPAPVQEIYTPVQEAYAPAPAQPVKKSGDLTGLGLDPDMIQLIKNRINNKKDISNLGLEPDIVDLIKARMGVK